MTTSNAVQFRFRPDLIADHRSDGMSLFLPSEGRGFVARGLTGHLVTRLWERFGDSTFGLGDLEDLADGVDARAWRRLVKELCSRGAVIRPGVGDEASNGREAAAPVIGIVGDGEFVGLLRDLRADGEPDIRFEVADPDLDPGRHLATAWRDVTLVVSFDSQPKAAATRAWNRVVVAARRTYLPVRTAGRSAEIGPLVVPGESACFECYWWRRQAQFGGRRSDAAALLDGLPADGAAGRPDQVTLALARVHALVEVRGAVGLEGRAPGSLGAVVTVHGRPPSVRTRPVLRLHDCPACAAVGPT